MGKKWRTTVNHKGTLGKILSKETKERLSKIRKDRKKRDGFLNSQETRAKISASLIGKIPWNKGLKMSEKTKKRISIAQKGKKLSETHRKNISIGGKKRVSEGRHNNYKGGITPINIKIRNSLEYKLWREAVFKRDNWTCVWCEERGGKLNADHIKPFAHFPELRFAIDNGRTLCIECHKKTDNFGYKGRKNNYEK